LDVSTSVTGVCFLDADTEPDDKGSHIVHLDKIDFKKCKDFWSKADLVQNTFNDYYGRLSLVPNVVAVEEPLMGFQKGMSSAATITTLMRFNGIVSYIARNQFSIDPDYVSASHARKLCGIKMQRNVVAGMSGKEQVFKHMSENDLKHIVWPKKKNGKEIDASRDMCDAYVIARAACIMNK